MAITLIMIIIPKGLMNGFYNRSNATTLRLCITVYYIQALQRYR